MSKQSKRVEVFLSFADEDEPFGKELQNHLSNLQGLDSITVSSDSYTKAWQEWALNTANIILLLISPDFLASDYYYNVVFERALKRQVAREAVVVPIILRPCTWQNTSLGKFQVLPLNGKPITEWKDREAAYTDIVKNIQTLTNIISSDKEKYVAGYLGVDVYISFARKDELMLEEIESHLSTLKRQALINIWHPGMISAGMEWKQEIDEHLSTAKIILLLVSPHFLNSDYCYSIEMKHAMERHETNEARVIPIILRPCNWQSTPLGKLQILPINGKPITDFKDREAVLSDIEKNIQLVVQDIYQQQYEISSRQYTKQLLSIKALLTIDPTGAMFQLDKPKELERVEHELEDVFEKRISEAKERARIAVKEKERAQIAVQNLQKQVSDAEEQVRISLHEKEQAQKVTQSIQKEVTDAKEQANLSNQSMEKAERTTNIYSGIIAILLSCLLVMLFESSIHWFQITWILEHPNSFGLQVGFDILIIFIVFCVIGFVRFKQLKRRLTREELGFYLGIILPISAALIAILIGLFQLLGGPVQPH